MFKMLNCSDNFGKRFMSGLTIMMLTATVGAATYTWTGSGGSGDWGDNNNWNTAPTFDNAADIIFTGATQPATFLNVARTIRSMTFDANADTPVTIKLASTAGGGTLRDLILGGGGTAPSITIDADASAMHTLGGSSADGSVTLAGNLTVTHNGTANFLINRPVSGAGFGVIKAGTGTMTINNFNYTGATTVNGGLLVLGTESSGNFSGADIQINGGSTLRFAGPNTTYFISTKTCTFGSQGGGTFDVPAGWNFVPQGCTFITTGGARNSITVGTGGYGFNFNNSTITFNVSRGSDATSDLRVTANLNNGGALLKTGNGILSLNSVSAYYGSITINGGTLLVDGAGVIGNAAYNSPFAMANGASFVYASSAAQSIGSAISGNGSLTKKIGSGTLTLSGACTYSGATTISNGTLSVTSSGTIVGSMVVTVAAGAQLTIANTGNVIANLASVTLDGTMNLGSGVNETVGGLCFGTAFQAAGTWGSSSSAATYKDDTHFTGSGVLNVSQPQANVLTFSLPGYPTTVSTTNITCVVPSATAVTALAPVYTLSVGATCDKASGSAHDFTTPLTYTVVSSDLLVTNVYRVTVLQTPVVNGLALWLNASQIKGLSDGAQVDTWTDLSGLANNAVRQTGTPKYVASGLNGLPVVRFNIAAKTMDNFKFTRISTIRTVFWVLKESSTANDQGFLLGDDNAYNFHRGGTKSYIWAAADSSANIRGGVTKLMGTVVNGTATVLPSDTFKLLSVVTTGNVQANQVTQDRNITARNWCGDIAEILIYDRALSTIEENSVGAYLTKKYALTTAYELVPQATIKSFSGPDIFSVIDGTNIACTVHYATGVTNLAPVYTLSLGATCDKASGSVRDFTSPVAYTVISSDALITNVYSVSVTILPNPSTTLIGHWVSGATNLADTAGFTPSGTHDGVAEGANAALLAYSTDVPPDFSGKSLNLTAGNVGVRINNTKTGDGASYTNTFDTASIRSKFTVSFWAKGFPAAWAPWVSKDGEGNGWQVRRYAALDNSTFSVRGTAGSDDCDGAGAALNVNNTSWHHFAAVYDGVAGTRQLYIDGVDRMNLSGDFGTNASASATSLELGARSGGNFFSGLIYDVRIYAMALNSNEVQTAKTPMAPPQAQIYTFAFGGLPAVITETNITCTVPFATDLTTLAPVYTMSSGARCDKASGTTHDFTSPVTYTVTSSDSAIVAVYTVTATRTPASTAKAILTYGLPGLTAVISGTDIAWMLPYGMAKTSLAPAYTVSTFATGAPVSGSTNNFTTPQAVIITAQDGSTQTYTVTVTSAPDWQAVINVNYSANVAYNMNGVYSFDAASRGSASQVAPVAYGGIVWNDFGGGGVNSASLLNSKGVATGIGLTTTMWQGPWNQTTWDPVGNRRLLRDGMTGGNVSYGPMLSLTGLNPAHTYDITIVSGSWGTEYFRVGAAAKQLLVDVNVADWVEGKNFVRFARLTPATDGTLVVEALAGTGNRYDIVLNGFQLVDNGLPKGTLISIW